jgi:hypothetical protein
MRSLAALVALALYVSPFAHAQNRVRKQPVIPQAINRPSASPYSSQQQQLPIRRVILYSNGVAYFERRGTVTGHAEVALQFKQSQVDDVLKSMVVLDMGQGRIGAVSYNSSAPPQARLNDIPFSIASGTNEGAQGGLAGVLKQLQGARVVIATSNRTMTGSILTVEERKSQIDANKPPVITHTLVIASSGGELSSFDLADVRSIKLLDEGAQRDITQFADATASARRRDAKTIVVTSEGAGPREMVVSYTVAAPIWKTSYRVVLDSTGQPFFQGWAIVDNVTEEDWTNVNLSLVSGTPVSFIQPIQQPLYRYRPVVPIPSDLRLAPQDYEPSDGGEGDSSAVGAGATINAAAVNDLPINGRNAQSLFSLAPGARGQQQYLNERSTSNSTAIGGINSSPGIADEITANSSVEAAATGEEVGDLFEYRIDQPVSVPHDRSALIPILQTRLEGDRVSIYKESARRDRPMSGMRLKNISALTLEEGPLTVIDGNAYAGEALMGRFKPGEQRLVSFALDLGTLVIASNKSGNSRVGLVSASNGAMHLTFYQTDIKSYKLVNQTDKLRVVYVEHPRRTGWELSKEMPNPTDTTQNFYRFRVEVPPHENKELTVSERRTYAEQYQISDLETTVVDAWTASGYLDGALLDSIKKIMDVKSRAEAQEDRVTAIGEEKKRIAEDQARLRENIRALKDTAEAKQLIARYVSKADQQESRLEQLTAEENAARAEQQRLEVELNAMVQQLSITKVF